MPSSPEERVNALFVVKGTVLRAEDMVVRGTDDQGGWVMAQPWSGSAIASRLRARDDIQMLVSSSAELHVREICHALSAGIPMDPRKFLRTFRSALRFDPKDIENPTKFVRNFILNEERISLASVRQSIETYRAITARITNLRQRLDRLRTVREAAMTAQTSARAHKKLLLRAKVGSHAFHKALHGWNIGVVRTAIQRLTAIEGALQEVQARRDALAGTIDTLPRRSMPTPPILRSRDWRRRKPPNGPKSSACPTRHRPSAPLPAPCPWSRPRPRPSKAGLVALLDDLTARLSGGSPLTQVAALREWLAGQGGDKAASSLANWRRGWRA